MLEKLNAYYEEKGISPVDFRCEFRPECSAGHCRFTEAKASFVGPAYGDVGHLPRLVFLSLDSGSACEDPTKRTAEAVRSAELRDCVPSRLPKNKHWYRTHEMALKLLHPFDEGLTINNVHCHFAHVNSAKCCQNKGGRRQADAVLFKNCRSFVVGELELLAPDVVVTQGGWAKATVKAVAQHSNGIREHCCDWIPTNKHKLPALVEMGYLDLRGTTTLWLHTYHPSSFGRFHPQRHHCWCSGRRYVDAVRKFWGSRDHGRLAARRQP